MREDMSYTNPIQLKNTVSGLQPRIFNCTYALLAVGFNILLTFFLDPETDYLIWIGANVVAAILFHVLILARKRHKFKHLISNYELETILSKAKDRVEVSRKIELWLTDDEGFVLANTTNLLFSCIIMSSSVITRLLEKPVVGELIVADEVLLIENGSRKFLFVWDFMHYSLFTTGMILFQGTIFLFLPVGVFLLQIGIILLALALFTFTIYSRRITSKPTIETVYGRTRLDAENEIFGEIDRGFFPVLRSSSRPRMDESSEFRLGMLPAPFAISLICGFVTYIVFTTILSIVSERMPYIVIPLSILFAVFGFMFSFELINPIKYETTENRTPYQDSPIEDEQTASLAELLHELPQYVKFQVRKRKTWDNRVILIISRDQDTSYNNATLRNVVLKHLEPDELFVYSLAELKKSEVRKNQNKWLGRFIGILTLLIFLWGFIAVFVFHQPFMEFAILLVFLYVGLLFASLAISTMRIGSKFQRIDVETQEEYPSLYTILEKLQDKGSSYEVKEHKERFEYLTRYNKTRRYSDSSNHP